MKRFLKLESLFWAGLVLFGSLGLAVPGGAASATDLSGVWRQSVTVDGDDVPASKALVLKLEQSQGAYVCTTKQGKLSGTYSVSADGNALSRADGKAAFSYRPAGAGLLCSPQWGCFKRMGAEQAQAFDKAEAASKKARQKKVREDAAAAVIENAMKTVRETMAQRSSGPLDGFWHSVNVGPETWYQCDVLGGSDWDEDRARKLLLPLVSDPKKLEVLAKEKKSVVTLEVKFPLAPNGGASSHNYKCQIRLSQGKARIGITCVSRESYQETVTTPAHEVENHQVVWSGGQSQVVVTKEYVQAETRVEERWRYIAVSEDEAAGVLAQVYLPMAQTPE